MPSSGRPPTSSRLSLRPERPERRGGALLRGHPASRGYGSRARRRAASTATRAASRGAVGVWIDFVCPYCLLGERVIRAATEGLDVDVVWMPFELRPQPTTHLRATH